MLTSITLQNFKSFGAEQIVPLRPISVLVGPNNSGKSSFLSVGRFVRDAVYEGDANTLTKHGGDRFLLHRPPVGDGLLELGWSTDAGSYKMALQVQGARLSSKSSRFRLQGDVELPEVPEAEASWNLQIVRHEPPTALAPVHVAPGKIRRSTGQDLPKLQSRYRQAQNIVLPLARSRDIKLSLEVLRQDSNFVRSPVLGSDGSPDRRRAFPLAQRLPRARRDARRDPARVPA